MSRFNYFASGFLALASIEGFTSGEVLMGSICVILAMINILVGEMNQQSF